MKVVVFKFAFNHIIQQYLVDLNDKMAVPHRRLTVDVEKNFILAMSYFLTMGKDDESFFLFTGCMTFGLSTLMSSNGL